MSRTYKDLPYRVRVKRAIEEGKRDHHHNYRYSFEYENEEYIKIPKVNASEIYKVRQDLKQKNVNFTEEEKPAVRKFFINDDGALETKEETPKLIIFTIVEKQVRKSRISEYCIEPEFYDHNTGRDTRNGKFASCEPYVANRKRCRCLHCSTPKTYSPKNVNSHLCNLRKVYNSGLDIEEIEEYDMF